MADQQELLDQYHSGKMSPEQIADFENQLASNPELKTESNLQSDIISGLKEVRKAQLKSRLNAIDVSPGWMEFAMQSTLVKSFGGVAVATLIGSGVYLFAEKQEIVANTNQVAIEISAPQPKSVDLNLDVLSITDANESISEEVKDEVSTSKKIVSKKIKLKTDSEPIEVASKSVTSKEITPEFSAPSASLIEDDNQFETVGLDALPEASSSMEKKIDVSTENVKSLNIKYKYYDGKLFLSGDFDRAPYEILEINSAKGRRIYIQYLNTYYQVKTTDKLTNLPEVTDQKLIQELKLLKDNK